MNTTVRVKVTKGERGTLTLNGSKSLLWASLWLPHGADGRVAHKEYRLTVKNPKDTQKFLKGAAALQLSGGVEVVRSFSLVQ